MKIITIANQKGGVGKSALSLHIAFYLHELGKKVVFIDLDPQGNSSSVLGKTDFQAVASASSLFQDNFSLDTPLPDAVLLKGDASLVNNLDIKLFVQNMNQLIKSIDDETICIVDTAPTASALQIAPLIVSDCVVSPIELESFSIAGIASILNTLNNIKEQYNPRLNFLGIVPNRVKGVSHRQLTLLEQLRTSYSQYLLDPDFKINERQAIPEALDQGIPVWRLGKTSAREVGKEMKAVVSKIYQSI